MSKLPKQIKTSQLVKAVKKVGFIERQSNSSHTVYYHPDGAMITIPTGRTETPEVFLRAILAQVKSRNENTSKDLLKELNIKT